MKSLIIFLFILMTKAFSCEVFLKKEIIINDVTNDPHWNGLKTNCNAQKIKLFDGKIKYFNGVIPADIIEKNLSSLNIVLISEYPSLHISRVSDLIKKSYGPIEVRKIRPTQKFNSFTANDFELKRSQSGITLKNIDTQNSVEFSLEKKISVISSSKNITPFDKENIEVLVHQKLIWTNQDNPGEYFSSKNELKKYLKYYSLQTFIKKNSPIKKSDFRKKNLLTFGHPAKVILKNNNLMIKTSGVPQSNGGLGDSVFIRLKNKQIISAKVIDVGVVSANL